jgi:metal-dependent amidase/aminoacylase/carboxypeptidase family protein
MHNGWSTSGRSDEASMTISDHFSLYLSSHPFSEDDYKDQGVIGAAGQTSIANVDLTCDYHGKSAHASGNPWNGVNALDALVAAYINVSLLRQQISPDERIHGCILDAPKVTNVIPEFTRLKYSARSPTLDGVRRLAQRIRSCVEAGALATGCHVDVSTSPAYADFRVNGPLSRLFKSEMSSAYHEEVLERQSEPMKGSTDQGNVSYAVPALHAIVGIPTAQGSHPHDRDFTAAAGTKEAHARAVLAGKVMALCGWKILTDNQVYEEIKAAFEADRKQRPRI